ncbi:MAG: SDR family oxidoreductase [Parabacteroides sp.]|nr:SDR family oxidoreductase [Parabacteroides sp.]
MDGKRVFVTGGAKGIGAAIVTAFCNIGARVAFCDTDEKAAADLCDLLPTFVQFFKADACNPDELQKVINRLFNMWGDVDVIVNNVGISEFTSLVDTSIEQFDKILSTNLCPVFITSRALAIHRNNTEGKECYGRIINIASTRYLQSEPSSEGYAASKGGIVSLTHALALSFCDYNITVNCISPGWIQNEDYQLLKRADHKQHPSGRVGRPSDIANACLFLAAPENDFINGQNIIIDGGMTRKMIYCD